jgi:hypothetical protein
MREVAAELAQWLATDEPVAIATVVRIVGSAPRPLGATLIARSRDKIAGSVSKGCVESAVYEEAIDQGCGHAGHVPEEHDELLTRGRETRVSGVISLWRGRRSPPVVLHRSLWADAFALQGDIGMRDVLAGRDDVIEVAVTEALGAFDDVDTLEDHRRLASSGAQTPP